MRVLTIAAELSNPCRPTMGPTLRQIKSLEKVGAQMYILHIQGIPKLKYFQAWPSQRALIPAVDIVHAHYGYCGWLARSQFRKPVVVSFMGSDLLGTLDVKGRVRPISKVEAQANRKLAQIVDAVIVKSPEMANVVAPVKAHVVPNGVDLQVFKPMDRREARAALGWREHIRYVLFPGNPDNPRKCFPLAQAATAQAAKSIGEPLRLIPLWGVSPEATPLYMNGCDAMLMTSFIEGSPNVVKEAMACNLPVVSVPVGDVPELVAGVCGYEVCPRDAELIARALAFALTSTQLVEGRAALVRKGLDLDSVARTVLRIYEDVLQHRGRQSSSSVH